MFMEAILSYFGTYTPAADGAVASFKFEYLTTLASRPSLSLQAARSLHILRFCASMQSPLLLCQESSFPSSCLSSKAQELSASPLIRKLCRISVRTCFPVRRLRFQPEMIKHAGGKLCIMIAVAACLLITLQDIVGVLVGNAIGLHHC